MLKPLMCSLVFLTAVPGLAQDRTLSTSTSTLTPPAGAAQPVPPVPPVPPLPPLPPAPPPPPFAAGLPPALAEKLGVSKGTQQKIQELTYESNDALITLEAEHRRAQLALERELNQTTSNENTVKELVEKVGRAETAVRQNRVGLMLAIKKTLGPDVWQKVQAETGPGGAFAPPRPPPPPRPPAPPPQPAP